MLKDKDSKQSIRVTIRVRPLSDKEKSEDPRICVHLDQFHSLQLTNGGEVKKFTFDSINYQQSQQQIFERVGRRCTKDCLQGYNCTVFAYGQTGAGKTYTMMGVNPDHEDFEFHKGLIPRTMKFLFQCIDRERAEGVNFIIRCSFLEIYNEQIIDLLNKNNTNLQLREDTRKGVYVEGITEEVISRSEEIMDLLQKGSKSRHVGSTFYNETSSRSHSVFTMQIESKYSKNGVINTKSRQFNFIDLAGSERTKMSTGERLKQGCNINKSLMNLASVINALSEVSEGKMQHVNYRNSKLTFLLKDSLGGNSKTDLIANISPSSIFYQQTLSTLSFARRAKLIKREKASINEDSSGNLDSMKNQIKRLKQEVITLMGRLQSGQGNQKNSLQDPAPQMTSIMHQYVSEEIDKQTRLEMEILKLKERISHLQSGIKHYSSNETHLRMIITVLEDKISRLKTVETRLSANLDEMAPCEDDAKIVKEYFENQRAGLIKQLEALKGQSEGTRIMKELLKHAKIVKEDGEQEQNLKELLTKNTHFLNMIHDRLQEIAPEKQEIEFNAEFEKKVSLMEIEFNKKEQELLERMEQTNLELSEARNRIEENQKLLEEAINLQIVLQEKIISTTSQREELTVILKREEMKVKNLEEQIKGSANKSEEIISELKNQLSNKETEGNFQKKEIEALKIKIEKLTLNEKILKEEFDSLEEEKYKLDKTLLQSISEVKEYKNSLMKVEYENTLFQERIPILQKEKNDLSQINSTLAEELLMEKKNNKAKIEELENIQTQKIKLHQEKQQKLSKECINLEEKLKKTEQRLADETEELQLLAKQYQDMENQLKKEMENKEFKMKELNSLINQKEENGNEIEYHLNQLKAELINLREDKQTSESKLKKTVDELKEKLLKEHANFQSLEIQATERAKLYEQLSNEQGQNKKLRGELSEKITKITFENESLKQEVESMTSRLEQNQKDIDLLKEREKQLKVLNMQMKNQLFVVKKNSQIEVDAIQSQISLKDQHIDQIEKEHSKTKLKYEKQIEELQKELESSKNIFEEHEKSLKKSMESHLHSKEKKLSELKNDLSEKEISLKMSEIKLNQMIQKIKITEATQQSQQDMIKQLKTCIQKLKNQCEDLKNDNDDMAFKHEKEMEENQIVHNGQLDQKNQQIEALESQNLDFNKIIRQLEEKLKSNQDKLLKERQEKAELEVSLKTSSVQVENFISEITNLQEKIKEEIEQKTNLSALLGNLQKQKQYLGVQIQKLAKKIQDIEQNQQINLSEKEISYNELKIRQQQMNNLKQQLVSSQNYVQTIKKIVQDVNKSLIELREEAQDKSSQIDANKKEFAIEMEKMAKQRQNFEKSKGQQILQFVTLNESLQKDLEVFRVHSNENNKKIEKLIQSKTQLEKSYQSEINSLSEQVKKLITEKEQQKLDHEKVFKTLKHDFEEKLKEESEHISKLNILSRQKELLADNINELAITKKKQYEEAGLKLFDLQTLNTSLRNDIAELSHTVKSLQEENVSLKEQLQISEQRNAKLLQECQEFSTFKDRYELQNIQLQKMKKNIEEDKQSKQRLYTEVCKERENSDNLKMLIENSEAQVRQLEIELEEKDAIYKKLLQKIARNQNENKKSTSSEHYLKTIELLQKSRAEQLNLRRENDDLKKVLSTLKQNLQEKDNYIREVEKKSEGYCVSMHKRLEQIQKDYFELERSHERLIKEKKTLEKYSNENDSLKQQIKTLKNNANKMVQRQEELQSRFKKCSIDYIELEKQFEELKKGQILITSHDDKTNYINRLKAEVAALKTEKVLLTDSLNREREEKTKLKAEMRFGKDGNGDMGGKIELEKKINENKNLQELIFQIVSHLKICVNEPKTKLQTIRSVILGTIKEKNNEIKILKEKIKQFEETPIPPKVPGREAALKEFRGVNSTSYSRNLGVSEEKSKFQKQRDPSILDNQSRQKMREFQNYYARFKQPDQKFRNA